MTDELKYEPMETAPRDGTNFNVKCTTPTGVEVLVVEIHYGPKSMGKHDKSGELILWGRHNFLSTYLTPIGWRPMPPEATSEKPEEPPPKPYDRMKTPRPI